VCIIQVSTNFSTLSNAQQALANLSNRVLEIAKPEPLKITLGKAGVFLKSKDRYKDNRFFVFANKIIPARGQFSCDQNISDIHAFVMGNANLYVGGSQGTGGAFLVGQGSMVQVDIMTPLITLTSPLMLEFHTKDTVRWCRFNPT
jgi:hypothetical protein